MRANAVEAGLSRGAGGLARTLTGLKLTEADRTIIKIIFLNRYFFPDHSATSQLLSDVAFHLAQAGHEVHVICTRQLYESPEARLAAFEKVSGVRVHRVWTSAFGRGRLPGRALDYLTFCIGTGLALLRLATRGDVVVAKTDPPLLSLVAWPVARVKGARLINWLQDIFPEIAGALGMGWANGWIGRHLARARDRTLNAAEANVVVGEDMGSYLASRGVDAGRIRVIPNWTDGSNVRPVSPGTNRLRSAWRLDGRFVVGYSGNIGRAHEFDTILQAAQLLSKEREIVFLFIGGGAYRDWVQERARERGLSNVRLLPYQPRENLAESLSVPDVHLISLRPGLERFMVPSKFYGVAAAGRPAIFVGSLDGDIPRIIGEAQCGIAVLAGDAEGLRSAIIRLKSDTGLRETCGRNARRVFEQRYEKRITLAAWSAVLSS